MSQNVDLVREVVAAWNDHDIDRWLVCWDPRCEWVPRLRGQVEGVQRYRGHEGLRRYWEEDDAVWDEFRIEQVLTNLITNALRYGGGRQVEVSVRQEGGRARMSVRDRGPGIAAEDHGRIFEQFERTDDSRRQAPGLGLGLYIARQIVRSHGGEIELESAPGQGATFSVNLPLRTETPA